MSDLINAIKKSAHAMGWPATLWALFWYPFAITFLFGFASVVAITNLSIEEGVQAFRDAT